MRLVLQRVNSGKVSINKEIVGSIKKGLVILVGISEEDNENDVKYLVDKVVNLRIFEDENSKMNLSVKDIEGEILVISQFTLYGDCRKGRRPNFTSAAKPDKAKQLYEDFINKIKNDYNLLVETGAFGEYMEVSIENTGPVTILLDSSK